MKVAGWALGIAVILGVTGWVLSRPVTVSGDPFAGLTGDVASGAQVFWAAGCASCHVGPDAPETEQPVLAGGYRMESPFGTFIAPNISPSPAGIGGWTVQDLGNALLKGVSPAGRHYYPALPYPAYQHMTPQDVVHLKAFLDTLPPSDAANLPHELTFPFTIRRALGVWKWLNLNPDWVLAEAADAQLERGRYLVEGLSHCAECHTPRNLTGGLDRARWMAGAPNPSGKGQIPGIAPAQLTWSAGDITYFLETGFTPDFDSAGGTMARVVRNMARLPASDREAITAYLKALPVSSTTP
jgi:mono/diheme cytochrome c family protein